MSKGGKGRRRGRIRNRREKEGIELDRFDGWDNWRGFGIVCWQFRNSRFQGAKTVDWTSPSAASCHLEVNTANVG
jgi:hypothetical protein